MKKVYLKHGSKDKDGNPLDTRTEYTVIVETEIDVTISNGYRNFRINHEDIKKQYRLKKS